MVCCLALLVVGCVLFLVFRRCCLFFAVRSRCGCLLSLFIVCCRSLWLCVCCVVDCRCYFGSNGVCGLFVVLVLVAVVHCSLSVVRCLLVMLFFVAHVVCCPLFVARCVLFVVC